MLFAGGGALCSDPLELFDGEESVVGVGPTVVQQKDSDVAQVDGCINLGTNVF